MKQLIQAGADIDILSNNSMKETPLHVCCKMNRLECCCVLVKAGANLALRDGFGHSASYWAHIKNYGSLIAAAGLPAPHAAAAKETLELLSQRCKTVVVIKPPKKKKKGKTGAKKTTTKKKK